MSFKIRYRAHTSRRSLFLNAGAFAALALVAPLPVQAQDKAGEPIQLGPVKVEDKNAGALERSTGLSILPNTVQDTPQTINVISQELLQQQAVTTLDQALRNVAGITVGVGEGGGAFNGDQFRIRGFDAKDDVYLDGLRDFGVYTRDSFNYDSVQVLKGPSSTIFGRGTTGGGVNIISKTPTLDPFTSVTVFAGTDAYLRGTADVNMLLDDTTALRVNLLAHSQDIAGRDVIEGDRWGIAPTIAFGIGTDTLFTLGYLHQSDQRIPDYGIPTLLKPGETYAQPVPEISDISSSTFYGFTRDYDDTTADIVTGRVSHKVNNWLTLNNDARVGVYSREFSATRVSCNAGCLTNLFDNDPTTVPFFTPGGAASGTGPYSMNLWGVQNILSGTIDAPIGGLRNKFVGGLDVSYQASNRNFYNFSITRPDRNAFNPDHDAVYSIVPHTTPTTVNETFAQGSDYALFASDQLWFNDQWSVIAGGRWDRYHVSYESTTVAGTRTEIETGSTLFNPKVAVVYEPTPSQTFFVSWARSATPQGTSVTNQPTPVAATAARDLDPEKNEIYEAGAKVGFFENRLGIQASVFQVKKNNAKLDDGLGNIISSGDKQKVQGVEFAVIGELTDAWSLSANYAFLDSETEDSTAAAAIGKEIPNAPKHSISLWNAYEVTDDLTVGLGAVYSDRIFLNNTNTTIAPYTLSIDGLIAYRFEQWLFQLNALNIFDRLNYSASQNGRAVPGARTVVFSVGRVF